MPALKHMPLFAFLFASSSAFALEPTYDLQHIYDLTNSLEFSHWAEELIPGAPEKGVLLFKIVSLTITLPLFAILLVWGIINDLQTETMMPGVSRIDYIALGKRIFVFIVFLGFGTAIYGYLTSLQRGMHSIIEIVCSQDSEFFLKAFYKESATNQNRLTRAIAAGKEDAVNNLLNTAKELVKYKDTERGAIRTVTRAHYMAIPLAAYNEALLLYSGDRQVSLPAGSSSKTYRNAAPCLAEYPALLSGENGKAIRGAALSAYASILRAYPEYPTCYAKSERDARAAMNEALNDTLAAKGQGEASETMPAISSARNPKPPSDADFAEFLIESIAKNSESNIAVPKFVRAQILFLTEYDPIVRQGITPNSHIFIKDKLRIIIFRAFPHA